MDLEQELPKLSRDIMDAATRIERLTFQVAALKTEVTILKKGGNKMGERLKDDTKEPLRCMQHVYLHGEASKLQKLYESLTCDEPNFSSVVIPESQDQNTKWEMKGVQLHDPYPIRGERYDPEKGLHTSPTSYFNFSCWTIGDAPIAVWEKLHQMGVEVQAEYEIKGKNIVGEFTLGEHHCRTVTE